MSTAEPGHLTWLKSSYSGNEGGECLEAAAAPGIIHVRDSKDPARSHLAFPAAQWTEFLQYAVGDAR
ncbi:DUF397 domain-containing protein [Streptomyces sp. NPDC002513]